VNHLVFSIDEKQSFLEMTDAVERVKTLTSKIEKEIEILSSERKIRSNVKKQMEKTQREYYLNEQLKAIQKELGTSEDGKNEFDEIDEKIYESDLRIIINEMIEVDASNRIKTEELKLKLQSHNKEYDLFFGHQLEQIIQHNIKNKKSFSQFEINKFVN
jgi:ATP-dependent Lon protease